MFELLRRKPALKWLSIVIAVFLFGYLIVTALGFWGVYNSPEQTALRSYFASKLGDAAARAADTYYGSTPEETLQLFISALEKGDIDLASKYFEVEDRTKEYAHLMEFKTKGTLPKAIENLKSLKFDSAKDGYAFFSVPGQDITVILRKNDKGWKMNEL